MHLEPVAVLFVIGCVSFPQSCTLKEAFPNGCNSAGFPSETPPTRSSTITNTKVIRASDEEMTMGCFFFLHFVKVSSSVFIFMSFQFCPLLCSEAHTLWLYCTLRDYIFNTKDTILKCVRYLWYTTTFFLFDGFFFLIQGQLALWLLNCNQLLICCWELHVWTFSSA